MSGRSTRELLAVGATAATLAAAFYTCAPASSPRQQAQNNDLHSRRKLGTAGLLTEPRGQNADNSSEQRERTEPQLPLKGTCPPTEERVHEQEAMSSWAIASTIQDHASAMLSPSAIQVADETVPEPARFSAAHPSPQCPISVHESPSEQHTHVGSTRRPSVSASAWAAAMASTARVRALPIPCVPHDAWNTVVRCRLPLSVEAAGQLCFETELEREWHHARGDREILIGGWQARRERRQVGLDFVPCDGDASRVLSYKTDPGLPRPFNDTASVTVTETQTLHRLAGEEWVVASVATFAGLPKSDCLRVHTRYSFSETVGASATEVRVSVGAEWVAGVGVPWLLERLLERKILQDGQDALVDWERRVVDRAASFQPTTVCYRGADGLKLAPKSGQELEPELEVVPEPERHLQLLSSEEEDFSRWSLAELNREEAAILAELAALDAAITVPRQDQGSDSAHVQATVRAPLQCVVVVSSDL